MDQILELFVFKTTQIQNNLLDLMSTIIEYEECLRSDKSLVKNVLINKSVFKTIEDFVPKVDKNVKSLAEMIAKTTDENERLTQELSQCRRRESTLERQLQEVRRLYKNLKEETDWKETCDLIRAEDMAERLEANTRADDCLKSSLALILHSSANQRTVQSFMENQKVFKEFMSTIHTIFENQINLLVNNCSDNGFDPQLIETLFGITVNVFQCNEYTGEDIPQWIDSFITIQALDKRFLKSSANGLHYICFAANGTEELQKRDGIIEFLAKCLIDSELRLEFRLKTNVVKVIRRLIENSKDNQIGAKLFNEFIGLISLDRFRQMTVNETYITLKKGMSGLLTTLSFFSTHYSITED